jgi:LmbE family N-acetylglucosaminyl deacetylase
MERLKNMNKILVIAAHPDDECLSCAATMRKYANKGNEVYCLILGEGAICRETESGNLIKQSQEAAKIIGFKDMRFECLPDNKFDTVPLLEICQRIERHVKEICPDILFVHSNDLNIDHCLARRAALTACRPGCSTVKEICAFETPSSTEWGEGTFKPNVFTEVGEIELSRKFAALKCYETEIKKFPHPRSIRGLWARAEYWGQVASVEYAEAFELVRKIN